MTNLPLLDQARRHLQVAQAQLDHALASGEPTAEPRALLDAAQADVQRIEAALQETVAQDQARTAQVHLDTAQAMVTDAAVQIAAELAGLVVTHRAIELPEGLAATLAQARSTLAGHEAAMAEHEARLGGLRERLAGIEAQRQALIARRAAGRHEADDGPHMALLDADREGLANLIARAEQEVPDPARAHQAVAEWQTLWTREVQAERTRLLADLADQHQAILNELVAALRAAGRPWRPSPRRPGTRAA